MEERAGQRIKQRDIAPLPDAAEGPQAAEAARSPFALPAGDTVWQKMMRENIIFFSKFI